jgi:hypothetical protein
MAAGSSGAAQLSGRALGGGEGDAAACGGGASRAGRSLLGSGLGARKKTAAVMVPQAKAVATISTVRKRFIRRVLGVRAHFITTERNVGSGLSRSPRTQRAQCRDGS